MIVRLSLSELQAAIAEWLQRRGATVTPENVQLRIVGNTGGIVEVTNATAVVIVERVVFPPTEGPYR